MIVLFSPLFFFGVAWAAPSQEPACPEQREHLLSLLREGAELTQRRLQEVQESTVLSEGTRNAFRKSAEWLIAWLRDQGERLEGMADCDGLQEVARDAKAQITPVHLASLRISAILTVFAIDRLLVELPAEGAVSSAREKLAEARRAFRELQESGPLSLEELRARMRRALFLAEQGLRFLRRHGIIK